MNIYKKLQDARVKLQATPIRASGNNSFAKYTYLELSDFLPKINEICSAVGMCGVVRFGTETATLTLIDTDDPTGTIEFTSPMSSAELKGCHPVQNLGAVQSYLRRYLWMAAFEIVEHDALDSTQGADKEKGKEQAANKQQKQTTPPEQQKKPEALPLTESQQAYKTILGWIEALSQNREKIPDQQAFKDWYNNDNNKALMEQKSKLTAEDMSGLNRQFEQTMLALVPKQQKIVEEVF